MKFRGNAIKELIEKSGFEKEQIIVCETNTMGAMCARKVNEALLYRCATGGYPHGVYKYAMTLGGACELSGKSKWVTGPESRETVFYERARSDAVIVGGGTLRTDDPRLTSRNGDGALTAYQPARVVLSRSFDVPEEARLWDTSVATTIVMTSASHGKPELVKVLRDKGVDVVEFGGEFTMDKVLGEMREEAGCKRFGSVVGRSRRRRLRLVRFHACWHLWRQKSLAEDQAQTSMDDFGCGYGPDGTSKGDGCESVRKRCFNYRLLTERFRERAFETIC